jgi:translation initiation factor 1
LSGLFAGTPLERPVTCAVCERPVEECSCPRGSDGEVLLPGQQTAIVQRVKRSKGKIVTAVTGLDPAASDLPGILKRLKATCGAGGTVRDGVVEVQGEHRETVAGVLREMGYTAKVAGG